MINLDTQLACSLIYAGFNTISFTTLKAFTTKNEMLILLR